MATNALLIDSKYDGEQSPAPPPKRPLSFKPARASPASETTMLRQADKRGADQSVHVRLASTAFRNVLGRKQSNYGEVMTWLDALIGSCRARASKGKDQLMMQSVVEEGQKVFRGYQY